MPAVKAPRVRPEIGSMITGAATEIYAWSGTISTPEVGSMSAMPMRKPAPPMPAMFTLALSPK